MERPLVLTKKMALKIMKRACGITDINLLRQKENGLPDVYIFAADIGCLTVLCENDWYDRCGLYSIHIVGNTYTSIRMYFLPDTLERDYAAEAEYYRREARFSRACWVHYVGPEEAHKLVDQYAQSEQLD